MFLLYENYFFSLFAGQDKGGCVASFACRQKYRHVVLFQFGPKAQFSTFFLCVLTHCSLFLFCFPVRCLIDALTMPLCFLLAAQRLLEQVIIT